MTSPLNNFFEFIPGSGWLDFAGLLSVIFTVHVFLFVGLGVIISFLNRANEERRIQQNRRGEKHWRREFRHSLISLLVTSFSLSLGLYAQAAGWALTPVEFVWWYAPLWLFICMILFDAWFYFGHRLMHLKPLYRWHALHHRSVAPTVWSTFSDDPVDTLVMQGFYMVIPFLLPVPPVILIANRLIDHFNGTFGHCGFEYFASRISRWPSVLLCVAFHDQHHSAFQYNFANYFSFWDRLFGTIHPQYDQRVEQMERLPRLRFWQS